ncbi:MAG: hypothetical protein KatS3mg121_0371 [Gammaproteobacteria bacterium]|nr:MAG: hypothetical protein KatS3mg121_0371 [Gammaproteobacteria bacterium]
MRFLLVVIVLAIVGHLLRKALRPPPRGGETRPAQPETMVRCALCDLHLPRSEALAEGERHFCCADHRRRWRERAEAQRGRN